MLSETPGCSGEVAAGARRRRVALVLALLVLAPLSSGCLTLRDFLPTRAADDDPSGDAIVRLWVAAKPGGIGNEFAHYNVSFGYVGISSDLFLKDIQPMESTFETVDLLALEREHKAAPLGGISPAPGRYYGLSYTVTGASIAREEVVGNIGGVEVVRINETPLGHRLQPNVDPVSSLRVDFEVTPGAVIDLYVEVDLARSLIADEAGNLVHRTVPAGVSVYGGGRHKISEVRLDGGRSELGVSDNDLDHYGQGWEDNLPVPYAEIDVLDPVTEQQLYSGQRTVTKRMIRAVGLGETLLFDGRDSRSNVAESATGRLRLIDYRWEFGDGTTARGSHPTHAFQSGGIYDVSLTVKDERNLVGRTFMTLFVPYLANESVAGEARRVDGDFLLAGGGLDQDGSLARARHNFTFDEDQADGALHLGAYRVTLTTTTPAGALDDVTVVRMTAESAHFEAVAEGNGTLVLEGAAVPVWRGPLSEWVDPRIDVTLDLVSGALVHYELTVEALYFGNLSVGNDGHALHAHGPWPFGPRWDHLDYLGHVIAAPDDA